MYSTLFKGTQVYTSNTNQGILISTSQVRIRYGPEMTKVQFQNWLKDMYDAGTPLTMYFPLATPRAEEFTDTTTIAALEALSNSNLYAPITFIDADGNIGTNLSLQYNYVSPAPSPDKQGKIHNIGDNINLFDGELEQGSIDSATGANASSSSIIRTKNYITIPDGAEKLRIIRTKVGSSNYAIGLRFYDKNQNYLNYATYNYNYKYMDIDIIENAKYLRFVDLTNDLTNQYKVTTDLNNINYSPYNQGSINFKIRNKNLFDKNNILVGKRINAQGEIIAANTYNTSADFIKVTPNTQYYRSQTLGANSCVCLYDKNKNFIPPRLESGNTFTTTAETEYILTVFNDANLDTAQLEKGETGTTYEAHKEQNITIPLPANLELCKIGTYKDYLYKNNGKWYKHKEIETRTFTGEET